tara:strand:+ start:500 stop:709 length:210 start_codon:yes stop_codon:yes gene_type:complete
MEEEQINVEVQRSPEEYGKEVIYRHRFSKADSKEYKKARDELFYIFTIIEKLWKNDLIKWAGKKYKGEE